ncbi:MAG: hypothetical protein OCD01_09840 [Fibrobacterales bacterium]
MKRNFRKIPQKLKFKADKIQNDSIVVNCTVIISSQDLISGKYAHLKIQINNDELEYPEIITPNINAGKHSKWNTLGREVKRDDLPMVPYTIEIESPNFGDYSNGTHTTEWSKEKYRVDFIPPRHNTIKIELLKSKSDKHLFMFTISEVIDKSSNDYEDRLFDCINVMQENVYNCGVESAIISADDYLKTYNVAWEIFPPGTKEEFITRIQAKSGRTLTHEESCILEDRYDFFATLGAGELIIGNSHFQRYIGAKIQDDLVVFENIQHGNALYIMYEDWQLLSQKSRIDLLSGSCGDKFDRVIHTGDWKGKVKKLIKSRAIN